MACMQPVIEVAAKVCTIPISFFEYFFNCCPKAIAGITEAKKMYTEAAIIRVTDCFPRETSSTQSET